MVPFRVYVCLVIKINMFDSQFAKTNLLFGIPQFLRTPHRMYSLSPGTSFRYSNGRAVILLPRLPVPGTRYIQFDLANYRSTRIRIQNVTTAVTRALATTTTERRSSSSIGSYIRRCGDCETTKAGSLQDAVAATVRVVVVIIIIISIAATTNNNTNNNFSQPPTTTTRERRRRTNRTVPIG